MAEIRYNPVRNKVMNFLKQSVIPAIRTSKDVKPEKLISIMQIELGVSEKVAKECINAFINSGEIKLEKGVLTTGQEIADWLKEARDKEAKLKADIEKDLKEADLL